MRGVVWIPDWPVVTAVGSGQARPEEPIAVFEQRIIAVNGLAHRAGVRAGMKRRQAQSLLPELQLIRHDGALDAAHFERVVRVCEEHIAYLSVLEPGMATFFARGPITAAGSATALSNSLIGDIARFTGLEAHVGFGQGLLTSVLAARQDAHVRHMRPFVDAHPIHALTHVAFTSQARARISAFARAMEDLGVRRIGDLRTFDRAALATRFGDVGRHIITLLDGGDPEQVVGESYPVRELTVERSADPPLERVDQAAFLARQIAEELHAELTRRGVIAREIAISAYSAAGEVRERRWSVDIASAGDITDRVRWQLGAWLASGNEGPRAGIERIVVVTSAFAPAGLAQGTLWGGERGGGAGVARAVSRIQSLLGDQSVLVPERVGGRHPQEAHQLRLWDAAETTHADEAPWPGTLPKPWPNVVKAKPENITVTDSSGHECHLSALGTFYCQEQCADPTPAAMHAPSLVRGQQDVTFTALAGPWLHAVGWWNPQTHQRKAWLEAIDEHQRGYLIYRENNRWWLAGVYE